MASNKILTCGYSYHTKPFQDRYPKGLHAYLFRLQTEGACKALVDGRMQRIEAGDLLLCKPGDSYRLEVCGQPDGSAQEENVSSGDYFVLCTGSWLDQWWNQTPRPYKMKIVPEEGLLSIWRALTLEKRRFKEENPEMSDHLLRALCLGLDRAIAARSSLQGKPFIAARMKHFIDERACTPFQIKDLARDVGLSVSRTIHLFKASYGITIMQYAINVRLSMAEERMKYSTMTLEQIAETCGFGSYTYFYRLFRQKHGTSPAAFRERQRHSNHGV